jgi:D-xylose transport system permease protein
MTVLSIYKQWPGVPAILAAIVAGLPIGLIQGFWFEKIHVPSFVVTLASYLGWQGALLYTLGSTGTINMTDPLVVGVANARLPVTIGWIGGFIFIIVVAGFWWRERYQRARHGLDVQSITSLILRVVFFAIGILLEFRLRRKTRPSRAKPIELYQSNIKRLPKPVLPVSCPF